jgi:hypothetical protein
MPYSGDWNGLTRTFRKNLWGKPIKTDTTIQRAQKRPTFPYLRRIPDRTLQKAVHPEGPFENFDRVTDKLLERGFNTVRIDSFPCTFWPPYLPTDKFPANVV